MSGRLTKNDLDTRSLAQATDSAVAHCVRPRDVGSTSPASQGAIALARKLGLTTKHYSPRLRALPPLAGPSPDQFALELGQTVKNSQH